MIRSFWLLIALVFPLAYFATAPVKTDTVYKVHSTLSSLPATGTLYLNDSIPTSYYCSKTVTEASLKVRLRLGETYAFGSSAFTSQAKVKITAYGSFIGTSFPVQTYWAELNINESNPEELFIRDFINDYPLIKRFDVSVYGYTAPGGSKNDSLQLFVSYEEKFLVPVSHVSLNVNHVSPSTSGQLKSPVTFAWTRGGCPDIPNYQFQLLRIYNNDCPTCIISETNIDAVVDWNKALTIETGSPDTTLKISLVEGTGYYIWRVRPIGTYYDGGIADSRNWGPWSDASFTQGVSYHFSGTSVASNRFFYTQFNDTINWIYSRVFSEGDPVSPKVRIGEKINYANGLLQSKQNQGHSQSMQEVLVNQTVYDWSGRPALNTLPAPVSNDTLYYRKGFIKIGSTLYTAANFDENTNYKNPAAVTHGVLTDYYSNSNADLTIPNAEGYPFSRNLYEVDANNRVKEQSSPGETHRLKTINARTTRTLYGGVADMELIRVFGDEAPDDIGVHKVITVDPNSVASISYMSKEGQVIATCLSKVDSTLQDTLSSQASAGFNVIDTISGNISFGDYGVISSKPLALATPTNVTFNYSISAKSISDLCTGLCNTCDYTIELAVKNDDTTYSSSKLLASQLCGGTTPAWDTTFTMNLAAGSYVIQKRVFANNNVPGTELDSTGVVTYLEQQLDSIRERLEDSINTHLSCIYTHLANSDLSALYGSGCLDININVVNPDSVFADSTVAVSIGCAIIQIPILSCPGYDCSDNTPDFEAYFNARWAGSAYVGTDGGGYLRYFPNNLSAGIIGYQPGEFNAMINNMLLESGETYNCEELWKCWERLVQSYDVLKSLSDTTSYNLDLLQEFLTCTGTKYAGYSTSDATKYKEKPYKYFYYALGGKEHCDSLFDVLYGAQPWAQDSLYGLQVNQKYKNYYGCIKHSTLPDGFITPTVATAAATAECGCKGICETRYESFKQKLIQMYHNDSIYVEGDIYKLRMDTTWGQVYAWDTALLIGMPDADHYRTIAEIECAAQSLVEECKKKCEFTIYTTGTHVDSVGSPAQILAAQQAMTWNFELSMPSCGPGTTAVPPFPPTTDTLSTIWQQHYGSTGEDQLWDIVEDKSGCGGYLLAGWTQSTDTTKDIRQISRGGKDYWVIKVNCDGNKLWDLRLGGGTHDVLSSVVQTADGGYLIGGSSLSDSTGDKTDSSRWNSYDYWVIRIDPNGVILWDKTFGGAGNDQCKSVTQTADNHFLLGGYSDSNTGGEKTLNAFGGTEDYWLIKTDANGEVVWDKQYGYTDDDEKMASVREAKDGNYLMAGTRSGKYWLVKADTAGTTLFNYYYGGDNTELCTGMEISPFEGDSSILLVGTSNSDALANDLPNLLYGKTENNYGGGDGWVVKVANNGAKIWDKTIGGSSPETKETASIQFIANPSSPGILVGLPSSSSGGTGNKVDSLSGSYDYWVVKLDTAGNKKWDRSYTGLSTEELTAVGVDRNYNFWIAGYSNSDSTGGVNGNKKTRNYDGTLATNDFWVIKAREYCGHDTICLRWVQPQNGPDSLCTFYEPISCDSANALAIYNSIQTQVGQYIQTQLDAYEEKYKLTCANPDSLIDTFTVSYPLGYHHYTLYYYDRAGNLVRTVPPKGVQYLTGSQLNNRQTHPAHTFVTKYTYNSLKQLTQQYSPDGDTSWFYYNHKAQLRFSQNKKQKQLGVYSYSMYDNLSRITEVGESSQSISTFTVNANINSSSFPASNKSQRTYTIYSTPDTTVFYYGLRPQRYLQNRVSYTYTDDGVYTYYSYDPHGNVEWIIQDIPGLGKNYIGYEYDLVSNKVLRVKYNEGAADQFHHRYTYDEDQRLKYAETSTNGQVWDKDAIYSYYKHGPLKRTAIGEDKIQGMDMVYTINGWLKAINHPALSANDPGNDGTGNGYSEDMFGMVLGYHANDFNRTSSPYNPSTTGLISSQSGISNLYNGNITSWTLSRDSADNINKNDRKGFIYRYDQLNRIKKENYNYYSAGSWHTTTDYDNEYTYDANGNISTLIRNAFGGANTMDNQNYNYISGTNKLEYVDDNPAYTSNQTADIDDQSSGNYTYDAIGNLISDAAEGIDTIMWNVYGKVSKVIKSNGDTLEYTYDALQNKIKQVIKRNAGNLYATFYVRDASGNIMSMYSREVDGSNYVYKQKEVSLYGSDRIGIMKPDITIKTTPIAGAGSMCPNCPIYTWVVNTMVQNGYYERLINIKEYEYKDHLGNVRVTFSDRKSATGTLVENSYSNYYAFGMKLPGVGKNYNLKTGDDNGTGYTYGYNGKEQDFAFHYADGEAYDFGARIYDGRLGRWLSIDPKASKYPYFSPYLAFGDNPIVFTDPQGETLRVSNTKNKQYRLDQEEDLRNQLPVEIRNNKDILTITNNVVTLNYELVPDKYKNDKGVQLLSNLILAEEKYMYKVDRKGSYLYKGSRTSQDIVKNGNGILNVSKTPYSIDNNNRKPENSSNDSEVTIAEEGGYVEAKTDGVLRAKSRASIVFHELSEAFYRTTHKLYRDEAHNAAINDELELRKQEAEYGTPVNQTRSSQSPGKANYITPL